MRYPRRILLRWLIQTLGRTLLPVFFKVKVIGKENFPKTGPLIVVGNHVAAMEAVLMVVYTPWQVEMVGAADIPNELITEIASRVYGFIPINRGHIDRSALTKALDVLSQGGIIGIFPEGGIWESGAMKAQTGVSWLSYRGNAEVLPIAFSGTAGAMNNALRLKRPELSMVIGKPIPAASMHVGKSRKESYTEFASGVLRAIRSQLLEQDQVENQVINECYKLELVIKGTDGRVLQIPEELNLKNPAAIAKFLQVPTILKILKNNLRMNVGSLQALHLETNPNTIAESIFSILAYLDAENPYLLIYRFGPKEGRAMQDGLAELHRLLTWASLNNFSAYIKPIHQYTDVNTGQEITRTTQGSFERWM